jgi:DNA modification methylase
MSFTLYHGGCRDVLDLLVPANSVDAVVTDPPYMQIARARIATGLQDNEPLA